MLFALHAGALADRLDRRRTMVSADLIRAVLIGSLAALVALEHETLWVLYVVAFWLGVGGTLFDTAAQVVWGMMPIGAGAGGLLAEWLGYALSSPSPRWCNSA